MVQIKLIFRDLDDPKKVLVRFNEVAEARGVPQPEAMRQAMLNWIGEADEMISLDATKEQAELLLREWDRIKRATTPSPE
jgi:hypothetical protein